MIQKLMREVSITVLLLFFFFSLLFSSSPFMFLFFQHHHHHDCSAFFLSCSSIFNYFNFKLFIYWLNFNFFSFLHMFLFEIIKVIFQPVVQAIGKNVKQLMLVGFIVKYFFSFFSHSSSINYYSFEWTKNLSLCQ